MASLVCSCTGQYCCLVDVLVCPSTQLRPRILLARDWRWDARHSSAPTPGRRRPKFDSFKGVSSAQQHWIDPCMQLHGVHPTVPARTPHWQIQLLSDSNLLTEAACLPVLACSCIAPTAPSYAPRPAVSHPRGWPPRRAALSFLTRARTCGFTCSEWTGSATWPGMYQCVKC